MCVVINKIFNYLFILKPVFFFFNKSRYCLGTDLSMIPPRIFGLGKKGSTKDA